MTPWSIGLLSALLLALQIVWMQALGYAQGHPLAYVVVSLALLGFGAGGSVLTLWPSRAPRSLAPLYGPALLLCAAATALLPLLARPLLAGLHVDLLLVDRVQWLRLIGLGGVIFLPFFCGAAALSVAFSTQASKIGPWYAANLLGSAAGAAAALLLLRSALPEQLMPGLALIALAAAWPARPPRAAFAGAAGIALACMVFSPALPRSPYKDLSYALQLPEPRHSGPFPHPRGRIDVVASPAQRHAPDLSLLYTGPVPAPPHIFVDGEIAGQLLTAADPAAAILAATPRALPFAAGAIRTALCLSPGGTPLLHLATTRGSQVTAVEPHPVIAGLMAPLLQASPSSLHVSDPRLFLAQGRFPPQDLIVFPERGLFGGPLGLQTLGEDTLFTVEALRTAWNQLTPAGWLAFNVWLDAPLRHAPRLLDLVAETLRAEGLSDPAPHVAIVRGWGSLSLIAGPAPLAPETLSRITAFVQRHGFDLLWPQTPDAARSHAPDETLESLIAALLGPDPATARARYRFDIRAPTDNQPFFNQFLRPGESSADLDFLSVGERGLLFLKALLGLLTGAVLLLVFLPLLPLRTSLARAPFTLPVFAGLGAGFMFFEIALIQRLTLLWGNAVTSAALVIAALLCGMGAGSFLSRNWTATPRRLGTLALGIAMLQILVLPVLGVALPRLLTAGAGLRHGGGVLLLLLCALPLGVPFPMAIRLLARHAPRQIPWACGIDGALAVLTAPAAALLAYRAGYSSLALASAAAYLIAAAGTLCCRRLPPATL
jgi:hypothetical protein